MKYWGEYEHGKKAAKWQVAIHPIRQQHNEYKFWKIASER